MSCSLIHHGEGRCDGCGKRLTGRRTRWCSRTCAQRYLANHRWTQAKAYIKGRRARWECEICKTVTSEIQVDHIVPCNGAHGTWGCHHHQDNLRLVCVPCHKKITAAQASARAASRRAKKEAA